MRRRRRSAQLTENMLALTLLATRRHRNLQLQNYCTINHHVPVMKIYFDGESELRTDYRLSRQTLDHLIQSLHNHSDHGWGHVVDVLVFVFWLASATSYRVVSRAFDIPRSTVHNIIHRVAEEILAIQRQVILLPGNELEEIGAGFARLAHSAAFSTAVGAIDGCQVRVKPPHTDSQCYLNRKLFFSIQLQAVCDHTGKFLDIFVGYTGSVHDSRVLRNSPLYVEQLYPPEGYCILGDGGYPCLELPICILTPYREPVRSPVAARFNTHHSRARNVVERSFGMLKTRWRTIFLKALEVKPTFAPKVIACCAILHNICLTNGDIMEPAQAALRPENHEASLLVEPDQQCGERRRERLAAAVSAPIALAPVLGDHDYI
ncbi:hypothetical protein SKAU_G00079900 [Synaphobranchus kaupii]|uniref:DDE Tnp4 domain-containing protein n=1 Tax=Synaphobranchus kaupii TaxID=118154 RepID=A0A9Q1FUQ1_SYNKA|nr:hypothetical protein SKAU_G00079900 [Synaphobranchus kaupii]